MGIAAQGAVGREIQHGEAHQQGGEQAAVVALQPVGCAETDAAAQRGDMDRHDQQGARQYGQPASQGAQRFAEQAEQGQRQ
ncbi:hypothetical protein D3C77_460690 [compost metagenome]